MQTYTHINYVFNKASKTVTLTWFSGVIEQIKLITDISTSVPTVIYDPVTNWLGGTIASNVLTLEYDTTWAWFNDTDKLEIIIDQAGTLSVSDIIKTEDTPHTSWDKWVLMLAIRSDSDTFTADDGDYTVPKLD
jgi:hypothetical protein